MDKLFLSKYNDLRSKMQHSLILSNDEYEKRVSAIEKSSIQGSKLSADERNWIRRFRIVSVNGVTKLFKNEKEIVKVEELFSIINDSHRRLLHGGRDIMSKDLLKYSGITHDVILIYLSLCEECQLKKNKIRKGVTVKPIISNEFNSRCQVDLIDLQARPDGDNKFIMVYQDHLTKFIVLNALKQKSASEVVENLIKIFAFLGPPQILHSDNGKEFANQMIRQLGDKFGFKIVHGKPRHSQSQGSVERANRDIGDMLTIYLRKNNTLEWSKALPFVQLAKNSRYHSGIGRSPYEALFGRKNHTKSIEVDENDTETTSEIEEFKIIDGSEWLDLNRKIMDGDILERDINTEEYERENRNELIQVIENEEELNNNFIQINYHRELAVVNQVKQAKTMVEISKKRFSPIEIGQNVRVPVPEFDRSKVDHRNVMAVVVEEQNGFYKLGNKDGMFKQYYARNQIDPCSNNFLNIEDVPTNEISLPQQ